MSEFDIETWQPPPAFPELRPGEIHVWRFGLDRSPETLEELRGVLDEEEKARAARFYFERDRTRFAAGRGILRNILARYLRAAPSTLKFEYGPQGKPRLTGSNPLEFNLSHSHQMALLALTAHNRLGADIEYQKENISMAELVRRFFAPAEVAAFQQLTSGQQPEAFFKAWTRKEAYLKACGGGLSIGLDRVIVSFAPGETPRIIEIDGSRIEAARWSLASLNPAEGYQAALVVENPSFTLKYWDWPG